MLKDQINNPIQQENLIDITGHPIDWYNSEEGWTDQRRHNVLIANDLMMEQFKNVPAYTKYGYKKMNMPKKLHHQILKSFNLNSTKLIDEIMHPRDAVSNWQLVTNNGTLGTYSSQIHILMQIWLHNSWAYPLKNWWMGRDFDLLICPMFL